MIIKFFPHPKKGSNPYRSINYLLKKKKDQAQVLQGNPQLSVEIAKGLDFQNKYTVGCLSFEEKDISEEYKQAIMQRFEETFFAGLKPEQYNICWIQHTDKERLELNFFIPNVELESGKRLSVYYDKADRPLADNFKQIINTDYDLSNPDIPQKRQIMTRGMNLPKDKKIAQEAINQLLKSGLEKGRIQNRKDVLNCLTEAGFEIARITPKNISIKTDRRNLRLKGAIYEQSFELNRAIEAIQQAEGFGSKERVADNYQRATEGLEKAIERRHAEFSKRFGIAKTSHTQRLAQTLQGAVLDYRGNRTNIGIGNDLFRQRGNSAIQPNDRLEAFGTALQDEKQGDDVGKLHSKQQGNSNLYQGRSSIQQSNIRRQSGLPNYQVGERVNDTDREAFERRIRQIDEAARRGYERIKRTVEQAGTGKPTIEELARKVFRRIEIKLQRKVERQRKMEEEKTSISFIKGRGLGL